MSIRHYNPRRRHRRGISDRSRLFLYLVLGVALWWFFVREEKKPVVEDESSAPYKVPEPVQTTAIPVVVEEPVVAEKAPAKPKPAARTAKPKAPAKAPVTSFGERDAVRLHDTGHFILLWRLDTAQGFRGTPSVQT